MDSADRDRVVEQVQQWRDDLVNLTRQNKLLYFKHTKSSSLEVVEPEGAQGLEILGTRPGMLEFFEPDDELPPASGSPVPAKTAPRTRRPKEAVCHSWAGSSVSGEVRLTPRTDLFKILRNLDRQARAEFMDKGLQSLYLAFGLLEWVDPKAPSETNPAPLYRKPSDPHYAVRRITPWELVRIDHELDDGDTLCVRGYCHVRHAERVFALKRMRELRRIQE